MKYYLPATDGPFSDRFRTVLGPFLGRFRLFSNRFETFLHGFHTVLFPFFPIVALRRRRGAVTVPLRLRRRAAGAAAGDFPEIIFQTPR